MLAFAALAYLMLHTWGEQSITCPVSWESEMYRVCSHSPRWPPWLSSCWYTCPCGVPSILNYRLPVWPMGCSKGNSVWLLGPGPERDGCFCLSHLNCSFWGKASHPVLRIYSNSPVERRLVEKQQQKKPQKPPSNSQHHLISHVRESPWKWTSAPVKPSCSSGQCLTTSGKIWSRTMQPSCPEFLTHRKGERKWLFIVLSHSILWDDLLFSSSN